MTQYDKALELFPNGMVTSDKHIKHFFPSDLLEFGYDEQSLNDYSDRTEEDMGRIWSLEYIT